MREDTWRWDCLDRGVSWKVVTGSGGGDRSDFDRPMEDQDVERKTEQRSERLLPDADGQSLEK